MKAQYDITIDLTKGQEEFWRQIDEIDNILKPKRVYGAESKLGSNDNFDGLTWGLNTHVTNGA